MPINGQDIIEAFANKLKKRYPDCRVIVDVVFKEVRVVEEDLSFKFEYIMKMYHSVNW